MNQLIGDFHHMRFRLDSAWESDPAVQRSDDFRRRLGIDTSISNPEPITSLLGFDCYIDFWGDRFSGHGINFLICDFVEEEPGGFQANA
jgi:hypothetical protein